MPMRKGRGRPKGSSVQKKVKESADSELDILDNPSNVLEVDPGLKEKQEADTGIMPEIRLRRRPQGSRVQNCQESAHGNLNSHKLPSNMVEAGPGCEESEEADTVTKKRGRGRPRLSRVQNCQENANGNLDIDSNPSDMLEASPWSKEEQEADTVTKKRGRERPRLSRVQNCQENANGNLDIDSNPSDMLEVSPWSKEEQEADTVTKKRGRERPRLSRVQNCQENANGNLDIDSNPSDMLEVSPWSKEEQEADTVTKKRGRERPRLSRVQNCQENANGNLDIDSNPSDMLEVSPWSKEEQEADTVTKKRGRGRPRLSRVQNCQENANGNLDIDSNPSDMLEVSPWSKVEQEADTSIKPKKKGRGRTRGLKVQMKRQQSADGKLDVLIHPKKLVAVGPGRKDFITDLSVIVRQNARHNVYKWKLVPQSTRDTIVQKILNNWRLPATDMVRRAILDEAGRLYRNWRNRLHDYYLMFETKEEALKHIPDDISVSDWQILVDYFSSPYFEIMSTKNKANKAKQLTNHTCGPKPFVAVSYDARDKVTGKEPDLQTLWQLTHKRANGEWVDEASKEINDKVAEQIKDKLQDSEHGTETIEPEIISTAFKTVVGKKSYMQGFGAGLRSSKSIRFQQLQAELEAQKRETENSRKECNEIRARLVVVESQLEEERRKREETEVCLVDRQKEMQEINSQVQTAIQSALLPYSPPLQVELEAQKRDTENAREECNEIKARLAEVESQLEKERQKREETEVRLVDRQKEMQEINTQVQTAIQSAMSHYCPPTNEAETSSRQKRKIAELDAQLHEAEDVITDLRSELSRYGRR